MRFVRSLAVGVLFSAAIVLVVGSVVHVDGPPDGEAGFLMALMYFVFPVLALLLGILVAVHTRKRNNKPENGTE
jgi:phosphotransferase system  glucose/maltose/N-acetylglucosamine-specific IIC component